MVQWYSYGYSSGQWTQTHPAYNFDPNQPSAISLPASCDSCQLWTSEYCLACSSGTFSSTGASCLTCSAGSYCGTSQMSTPTPCPAGTYGTLTGQTTSAACTDCSPASYSAAGATACTVCTVGYWATPTSTSCSPCINNPGAYVYTSSGTANNNCGLSSTPSCPSGTYADQPSGTCKSCMPGTFQATAVTSWGVCEICPAGSLCPSSGMVNANPCPAGFFSNSGSTVCTKICTSGQYAEIGMSVCSACAAGTAS